MEHNKLILLVILGILVFPVVHAKENKTVERDSLTIAGVGKESKWRASGAISAVKGEGLEKSFTQNIMNTLYGKLPGLTVMQGGGEPGSDGVGIYGRGINTFGNSGTSMLILVDGFEATMDQLVPQEIESVQFLKDAASVALYGSRGANGVLLIKTKQGVEHPLEVNFSTQIGINTPFHNYKYLDASNYALLYDEARMNDGLSPIYQGTPALEAYKNGSNSYLYPNVNWQDELLKNTSVLQNYNINFKGGNSTVRYFALLNVSNGNGFFKGTDPSHEKNSNVNFTRYNIRANLDVNISANLSASLRLGASIQDKRGPVGGTAGLYSKIAKTLPNAFPVINPNGSYGGNASYSNPLGDLLDKGYDSYNSRNLEANLRIREKLDMLIPGLSVSLAMSFNNYYIGNTNKTKSYPYYSLTQQENGDYTYTKYSQETSLSVNDSGKNQWRGTSYEGTIDYSHLFENRHQIDANLGFFSDDFYKLEDTSVTHNERPYRHLGMRGHVGYAYDQRYLADVTFNYSGSENFARGHRFGLFPALSLGWIISNESFLKDNVVLTLLKLRGSYGLTGNDNIGKKRFLYDGFYKYTASYYFGMDNSGQSGITEGAISNPDITWEKEKRLNIGFDATLFSGLDLSFDYFQHNRSDILVSSTSILPGVYGLEVSDLNGGKTTNRGFEVSVGYRNRTSGKLDYYTNLSLWYNKNKIEYMAEEIKMHDYLRSTGQGIGQPIGLKSIGLFKDQADIDKSPKQQLGDVKPGDIKYADLNKDGVVDNLDRCPIGYSNIPCLSASLTLGVKYKGFDIEALFYGVGKRSVYLSGDNYLALQGNYGIPVSALERWTAETAETAIYPRLSSVANTNNSAYSDFWQANGAFLKLRYLEVGYSFSEKWAKKIFLKDMRVFANGTNLFSLHHLGKYKNADPENMSGYPALRTVSLGLKLKF